MITVAKFKYKGNVYSYEGVCRFKIDDSWVDAIMYSKDNHMYVREILDFIVNFECIEAKNPLPGDTYLKKQRTVTDIIKDQLGSGYTPGFEADKTHIPAHEVESADCAQDDSKTADEYFYKAIKLKEKKINDEDSGRAK